MGTYKYVMRYSCDGGKHGQQYMEYDSGGREYGSISSFADRNYRNRILLFMDFMWNTEEQWKLLQIDITDYLENVCKPRLENEIYHPAELQNYQKEYFDEADKVVNFEQKQAEKNGEQTAVPDFNFTEEEEKVIREVIHEYLG